MNIVDFNTFIDTVSNKALTSKESTCITFIEQNISDLAGKNLKKDPQNHPLTILTSSENAFIFSNESFQHGDKKIKRVVVYNLKSKQYSQAIYIKTLFTNVTKRRFIQQSEFYKFFHMEKFYPSIYYYGVQTRTSKNQTLTKENNQKIVGIYEVVGKDLNLQENEIKKLDLDKRLHIVKKIVEHVKLVHEKGIVLRDIKPRNIVVEIFSNGSIGRVRLIDFEYVAVAGADVKMAGTPSHFDQSLYFSKTKKAEQASDIWSLGVTILQIIQADFKHPPFEKSMEEFKKIMEDLKKNKGEITQEIMDNYEVKIRSTIEQISILAENQEEQEVCEKLATLVKQMLNLDRGKRITIDQVAETLDDIKG